MEKGCSRCRGGCARGGRGGCCALLVCSTRSNASPYRLRTLGHPVSHPLHPAPSRPCCTIGHAMSHPLATFYTRSAAPCPFFRSLHFSFTFPLNLRTQFADIVSMTRILRSSPSFRNRARRTFYFFQENTQRCIFEVPCFNEAHAARVCAKLSAKFGIPLEYAE